LPAPPPGASGIGAGIEFAPSFRPLRRAPTSADPSPSSAENGFDVSPAGFAVASNVRVAAPSGFANGESSLGSDS